MLTAILLSKTAFNRPLLLIIIAHDVRILRRHNIDTRITTTLYRTLTNVLSSPFIAILIHKIVTRSDSEYFGESYSHIFEIKDIHVLTTTIIPTWSTGLYSTICHAEHLTTCRTYTYFCHILYVAYIPLFDH